MRARLDRAGGAAPPAAASRGAGVPAGAPRRPRRARTASCACDARDVWRPLRCTSVNLALATRPCCRLAASTWEPSRMTARGSGRSRRHARRGDAAGRPAAAAAGRPAATAARRPAAAAGGARVARGPRGATAARGDQVRPQGARHNARPRGKPCMVAAASAESRVQASSRSCSAVLRAAHSSTRRPASSSHALLRRAGATTVGTMWASCDARHRCTTPQKQTVCRLGRSGTRRRACLSRKRRTGGRYSTAHGRRQPAALQRVKGACGAAGDASVRTARRAQGGAQARARARAAAGRARRARREEVQADARPRARHQRAHRARPGARCAARPPRARRPLQ